MMREFEIGGRQYRVGMLNAFKQLHIVRRLTPCLGKLAPLFSSGVSVKKNAEGAITDIEGDFSQILGPLTDAVSTLQDDDLDYIVNACLEVTERRQTGGGWARVRTGSATMFDDLTLPALLQIVYNVCVESLADFFKDGPTLDLTGFMKARGLNG